MALTKMNTDLNIIAALDDEPNSVGGLSAAELETFRRCLETIENNMERLGRKEADAPPEKGETYD